MIKKIIPLVLLVFILLIAGCKEEEVVEGPFVGGSNGLKLSFAEGAPISEFAMDRSVPVKLNLQNNGEYDVPANSVQVALYGLAMSDYGLSSDYVTVSQGIYGIKKGLVDEGAMVNVDMGELNYQGNINNFIEPTLRAKVCYPYRTEATITACASSREIEESGGESVCKVGEDKINFVSGDDASGSTKVSSSPVQVTSFTEELEGVDRVKFNIMIEDKGLGDVYADDLECSEADDSIIKADKQDKVHFRVLPAEVTCFSYDGTQANDGYVKLNLGKKNLVCTMPVENTGSSYEREVTIYLDFKYIQSVAKQLKILES